jgi:hypothetical protein
MTMRGPFSSTLSTMAVVYARVLVPAAVINSPAMRSASRRPLAAASRLMPFRGSSSPSAAMHGS